MSRFELKDCLKERLEAELTGCKRSASRPAINSQGRIRGRLVEQDPSEEPAERLLARLNESAPQSIPHPAVARDGRAAPCGANA